MELLSRRFVGLSKQVIKYTLMRQVIDLGY